MRGASRSGPGRSAAARSLADPEQLDLEDQRGAGWDDAARAALAVAEIGRDDQLALAADLHRAHALVPTLDHVAPADGEDQRLAPGVRGGELFSVFQPPRGVPAPGVRP